jgi:hypothetical protein
VQDVGADLRPEVGRRASRPLARDLLWRSRS